MMMKIFQKGYSCAVPPFPGSDLPMPWKNRKLHILCLQWILPLTSCCRRTPALLRLLSFRWHGYRLDYALWAHTTNFRRSGLSSLIIAVISFHMHARARKKTAHIADKGLEVQFFPVCRADCGRLWMSSRKAYASLVIKPWMSTQTWLGLCSTGMPAWYFMLRVV